LLGLKRSDAHQLKRRRRDARSDKRFCSDACRQQYRYHTRSD
jgi:hypothetical protein